MDWYYKVLRNHSDFSGRARRKEYWMFSLFQFIFASLIGVVDNFLGTNMLSFAYLAISIFPVLAVTTRRFHDIGKSGWMLLILFIPIAGWVWFEILMSLNGDKGENKYGLDPKEVVS